MVFDKGVMRTLLAICSLAFVCFFDARAQQAAPEDAPAEPAAVQQAPAEEGAPHEAFDASELLSALAVFGGLVLVGFVYMAYTVYVFRARAAEKAAARKSQAS